MLKKQKETIFAEVDILKITIKMTEEIVGNDQSESAKEIRKNLLEAKKILLLECKKYLENGGKKSDIKDKLKEINIDI